MVATRSILNINPVPGCPFCLENGMIPEHKILERRRTAALIQEYSQNVPGTLQIIPVWDEMTPARWLQFLPDLFWLVWSHRLGVDFNLSINFGSDAGQTLHHPHVWLIPRTGDFAGPGLASLVALNARTKRELGMSLEELLSSQLNSN